LLKLEARNAELLKLKEAVFFLLSRIIIFLATGFELGL